MPHAAAGPSRPSWKDPLLMATIMTMLSTAAVGPAVAAPGDLVVIGSDPQVIAQRDATYFRHSEGSAIELTPGGRILLAWSRFRPGPDGRMNDHSPATIVMAHSDDAGHTWSEARELPVGDAKVNVMQAGLLRLEDRVQLYFSVRDGGRSDKYLIESRDGGQNWSPRRRVTPGDRPYTGPNDRTLRLSTGRLLLMCHTIVPADEGGMLPVIARSDDRGATWRMSGLLRYEEPLANPTALVKLHEPAVAERSDGSLLMLARSTRGTFFASESRDGGATWSTLRPSGIPAMTSPPYLRRLADGRIILVWNRPSDEQMRDPRYRAVMPGHLKRHTLAIAVTEDGGRTWSEPRIVATDGGRHGFCYPAVVELADRRELLIFSTRTPQVISPGDLVMSRVRLSDLR